MNMELKNPHQEDHSNNSTPNYTGGFLFKINLLNLYCEMKKENMNPINQNIKVNNDNNLPNKEDMTLLEKLQLRLEKIKKIIKP